MSHGGGDDRVELFDDTVEERAAFGENFGAFEFRLKREQVEGLLRGKAAVFDINGRAYSGFVGKK